MEPPQYFFQGALDLRFPEHFPDDRTMTLVAGYLRTPGLGINMQVMLTGRRRRFMTALAAADLRYDIPRLKRNPVTCYEQKQ
jgi:hypothetical protein